MEAPEVLSEIVVFCGMTYEPEARLMVGVAVVWALDAVTPRKPSTSRISDCVIFMVPPGSKNKQADHNSGICIRSIAEGPAGTK
jgi:hypothetical protein